MLPGNFSLSCHGFLYLVTVEVGMGIHFKQHSKLFSNTFHMNYRSSLYLENNLRFGLLYLVAGKLLWTFHFSQFIMWTQRPFQ